MSDLDNIRQEAEDAHGRDEHLAVDPMRLMDAIDAEHDIANEKYDEVEDLKDQLKAAIYSIADVETRVRSFRGEVNSLTSSLLEGLRE